jgi:hypothetical protein
MNCKIVKAQYFLIIHFASLLCFKKRKQAAVVTGEHRSVGCDIIDCAHSPEKWQFT